MIVINVLICSLLLLESGRLTEASDVDTNNSGRFQFLRRRTSSLVKKDDQDVAVITTQPTQPQSGLSKLNEPTDISSRKFIGFGLRQRTKSNERPSISISSVFSGLISSAYSGISKFADVIDKLEIEHQKNSEADNITVPSVPMISNKRAKIVTKLLTDVFNDFDHDEEDDDDDKDDSEIASGSSCDGRISRNLSASGLSVYGNDENSSEDENKVSVALEALMEEEAVQSDEDAVRSDEEAVRSVKDADEIDTVNIAEKLESNMQFVIESLEKIRSDHIVLSDSDSESWEKVERNIIDNVQVLVEKPVAVKFFDRFFDKKTIANFLTSVFIKLARRILFKPAAVKKIVQQSYSLEDFVTVFPANYEENNEEIKAEKYKFLDFETAHRVLYYNDSKNDYDDWCLILPGAQDFFDALDFLAQGTSDDLTQIETDLPRLPAKYYDFYAEKMGRQAEADDISELQDKIRLILAFIMAFESKELSSISPESVSSTLSPPTRPYDNVAPFHDQPILYSQGFEQIVAYFAINFDLDHAGPIAHRFFQLYMRELIHDLEAVRKTIDPRAVKIIRRYLRDQAGKTVLNFEVLLGILEVYPFSDRCATNLYFNSATTWTDLDRLIQFLLSKVPQEQASKSISLLAAANMLYSMLALDKLFAQELGSHEWKALKETINYSENDEKRNILDYLTQRFLGELYLSLADKIAHSGAEFDDFLLVAESLIPYLM